jgi:hypothetical protein
MIVQVGIYRSNLLLEWKIAVVGRGKGSMASLDTDIYTQRHMLARYRPAKK